jgi:hypothetical protein
MDKTSAYTKKEMIAKGIGMVFLNIKTWTLNPKNNATNAAKNECRGFIRGNMIRRGRGEIHANGQMKYIPFEKKTAAALAKTAQII